MWRLPFWVIPLISTVCLFQSKTSFAQISVSLPDIQAEVNETGLIPIDVEDLTGQSITAFQFVVTYDPAIIEITGATAIGTLADGKLLLENTTVSGEISISSASDFAYEGSGTLVNLEVNYLEEGTTALEFDSFMFNEGTPTAATSGGSVTVGDSGTPNPIAMTLPSVLQGNVGDSLTIPVSVEDVTGLNVTSYELTFTYDPAVILVENVSVANTMSSGSSPSTDAPASGEFAVTWSNPEALSGNGTLVHIKAYLVGAGSSEINLKNVTLNAGTPLTITSGGTVSVSESGAQTVVVTLPDLIGINGEQLLIPVAIGNVTGKQVTSFEMRISYDNEILQIDGVSEEATLIAGTTPIVNASNPGEIIVSWASISPLEGTGVLLYIQATPLKTGESPFHFESFLFNEGTPEVHTVNGEVTVGGQATYLQVVHNSSDAPAVDIYINDEKEVDSLAYATATPFIDLQTLTVKIDVVDDQAVDNSLPIATTTVLLENGKDYVAVVNGLVTGLGKQAIELIVEESQQEVESENSIGLVMFQGSPDAPPINAYIVDESGDYERILTLAKGLGFGDSFLTTEFEPGIYNIEVTQNNGPRIGIYRADLSRTGGTSLLFMVQGFINPAAGQPELKMTVYAPDGEAILLPVTVNNEEFDLFSDSFRIHGNYPNPFNPTTSIHFDLPEAASVYIDVFDLAGRNVLSIPQSQYMAGNDQAVQIDASSLSSGVYLYRVVAEGAHNTFVQSHKMTLIK